MNRRKLPVLVIAILLAAANSAWSASGTLTFTSRPSKVRQGQTLSFHGTHVMTEDELPSGPGTFDRCVELTGSSSANFIPFWCCDSSGNGVHADVHYKLDGEEKGSIGYVYNYPDVNSPTGRYSMVGVPSGFNGTIYTSSMEPGSSHTVTVYYEDWYGGNCMENCGVCPRIGGRGAIFAEESFTFTVCQSAEICCNHIDDNCNDEIDEGCTACDCDPCCDAPPDTCPPSQCGGGGSGGSGSGGSGNGPGPGPNRSAGQ